MIVADTTLISYVTIQGEHSERALAIRKKDPDWAAPFLWKSEFLNVLWKYIRKDMLTLDLAREHLRVAQQMVTEREFNTAPHQILSDTVESGCTYDCHYVALAGQLQVPLITHDRAIQQAFPSVAISPQTFL